MSKIIRSNLIEPADDGESPPDLEITPMPQPRAVETRKESAPTPIPQPKAPEPVRETPVMATPEPEPMPSPESYEPFPEEPIVPMPPRSKRPSIKLSRPVIIGLIALAVCVIGYFVLGPKLFGGGAEEETPVAISPSGELASGDDLPSMEPTYADKFYLKKIPFVGKFFGPPIPKPETPLEELAENPVWSFVATKAKNYGGLSTSLAGLVNLPVPVVDVGLSETEVEVDVWAKDAPDAEAKLQILGQKGLMGMPKLLIPQPVASTDTMGLFMAKGARKAANGLTVGDFSIWPAPGEDGFNLYYGAIDKWAKAGGCRVLSKTKSKKVKKEEVGTSWTMDLVLAGSPDKLAKLITKMERAAGLVGFGPSLVLISGEEVTLRTSVVFYNVDIKPPSEDEATPSVKESSDSKTK